MFCSPPVQPVVWATSKVGNRDDAHEPRFDLINDAKGEPVDKAATGILGHWRPCLRILDNAVNCCVDFSGKVYTESMTAVFVVLNSPIKLRFRMLVEIVSHFPCFARILAKTSSPGTTLALPSSIWDTRRSASSAQRRLISLSIGRLRLVRSFSTKLRRTLRNVSIKMRHPGQIIRLPHLHVLSQLILPIKSQCKFPVKRVGLPAV